jgi:nitrogen regulatory protein P-II 1
MKLITAIIQPDKLDAVREALIAAEITRITVSRVTGHGRQADEDIYRGQSFTPNLINKIRLEIACNDDFVERACEAIIKSARHGEGKIGDGKIFITPLLECIRIRTGERGGAAI